MRQCNVPDCAAVCAFTTTERRTFALDTTVSVYVCAPEEANRFLSIVFARQRRSRTTPLLRGRCKCIIIVTYFTEGFFFSYAPIVSSFRIHPRADSETALGPVRYSPRLWRAAVPARTGKGRSRTIGIRRETVHRRENNGYLCRPIRKGRTAPKTVLRASGSLKCCTCDAWETRRGANRKGPRLFRTCGSPRGGFCIRSNLFQFEEWKPFREGAYNVLLRRISSSAQITARRPPPPPLGGPVRDNIQFYKNC